MSTAAQGSTASSLPHGPSDGGTSHARSAVGEGRTPVASPGNPTPARDGDDACPGALRLHAADDGALARVRVPGGALTAAQASALADAAEHLGDGELHLTSRGNVQLRGLTEGCGTELAGVLVRAGLLPSARHERVRNVLASPLCGLDGRGHADVLPWAAELDRLLCDSPAAAGLSGRFLFAVDDGRGDMAALGADVTLVADPPGAGRAGGADADGRHLPAAHAPAAPARPVPGAEPRNPGAPGAAKPPQEARPGHPAPTSAQGPSCTGGTPGVSGTGTVGTGAGAAGTATLLVGGTAAVRVPGEQAPRAALLAAESFLDVVQERGEQAWRIGELPDGAAAVARALARRLAHDAYAGARGFAPASGCTPAPPGGEGAPGAHSPGAGPAPGTVRSPDGRTVALSVTAPFGTLTAAQWRLLAAAAETHGVGALRLTPWRGIVVPGLRPGAARARLAELDAAGLVTSPDSAWFGLGACAGRPGCAKALADVRADARDVVRHRGGSARGPRELPVHWSGCARRCGRPKGDHVDVVATGDDRYDLSVGGEAVTTADRTGLAAAVTAAAVRTTAAER